MSTKPRRASTPREHASLPDAASWDMRALTAFAAARDPALLEPMILAAATHPEAVGADVVHLLCLDAATGLWVLGATQRRAEATPALDETLKSVRQSSREPDARLDAWDLDALDPITQAAWKSRTLRLGVGSGEVPWSRAVLLAALPLATSAADHGLLVLEFAADDAAARARLDAFDRLVRVALELCQRRREGVRRADHVAALVELTRQSLGPRNVAELLHAVARLAAQHTDSHGAAVWTTHRDGSLRLDVTFGPTASRERLGRALHPVALAALESERARIAVPGTDEFLLPAAAAAELAACAVWPVVAYGRGLGAVAVWSTHGGEPPASFGRAERDYLAALAHIAALALDHARRFAELREAERRERESARYARQRERLAALGELVARGSHEAMKPLGSIRAFASRLERSLPETDPAREFASVIVREAERLERLLAEQRAHAELAPPRLERVNLNSLVERALQAYGEPIVARRARMLKKLSTDLPMLLIDRQGVQHVLETVLRFALDSIAVGGRIRLETRRLSQHVMFELGHDGAHMPGEALEQLFVPFGGSRPSGIGAGLSVAQRVIQEHGGEVRVRADGDWTTIVSFTLPVLGNQDRRGGGRERRRAGDRRRNGTSA